MSTDSVNGSLKILQWHLSERGETLVSQLPSVESTQMRTNWQLDKEAGTCSFGENYSVTSKEETVPFWTRWMNLEVLMLSEISQEEKNTYSVVLLTHRIWHNYLTKQACRLWKLVVWQQEGRGQVGKMDREILGMLEWFWDAGDEWWQSYTHTHSDVMLSH